MKSGFEGLFSHPAPELASAESLAASPAGTHDGTGGPSACQVRWLVRAAACGCSRWEGQAGWAFNAAWPGVHVGRCREHVCGLGWDHQPPVGSRHGRALLDRCAQTYPSPGRDLSGTCEAPWVCGRA